VTVAKVLVADDNPLTLRAVQLSLQLAGFQVVATDTPEDVVTLAEREGVDAAVLDVLMPTLSGFDVLHRLRQHPATAQIPVVFLSGLGEGEDRVRGLREGAEDYLVKPFEPAELALRLERLIGKRATGNETPAGGKPATSDVSVDFERLEAYVREGRPLQGVSLGRYEVQAVLGEGATGTVFRGWDGKLQRPVALKTIRLSRAVLDSERGELRSGLLREAVTAARFHHPNIVAIFDLEESREIAFIIMEFVNGMNLERYLTVGGALGFELALPLGAAVAAALAAAHANRVVHHDLKPANVLLGRDGSIKVSDFGIAMFLSSMLHREGRVFGTPGYLPPECLEGATFDERGDLFALGVTIHTCISGVPPFAGNTLDETVRLTMEADPPPPRRLDGRCPARFDELVMRLVDKDRRRRPASAAQVARELAAICAEHELRWAPAMSVLESGGRPQPTRSLSRLIKARSTTPSSRRFSD